MGLLSLRHLVPLRHNSRLYVASTNYQTCMNDLIIVYFFYIRKLAYIHKLTCIYKYHVDDLIHEHVDQLINHAVVFRHTSNIVITPHL